MTLPVRASLPSEATEPVTALERFLDERRERWATLTGLLDRAPRLAKLPPQQITEVTALYREVCTDRMRAEHLGCPPDVTAHLDHLVARAHNALYSSRRYSLGQAARFVAFEFPRALRANWGPFLWANVLFGLPFVIGLVGALQSERFAVSVLPAELLDGMAEAYAKGFAEGRSGQQDAAMAGFYVYNNVGIAFRCFATGILFGAGSLFFLVYNGVVTGCVMGHVIRTGGGLNILTFVAGHSPLELTAIVISGAAGLQMGRALIVTHGLTRLGSLAAQRRALSAQIVGAAVMLLLAALVEGFWSPSSLPPVVKWTFGGVLSVLVVLYLALAGRAGGAGRARA